VRKKSILCGLAVIALLFVAQTVSACSCAFGGAPCQEYWRVDAVFSGTVVSSGKITVDQGSYKSEMRLLHMMIEQPIRGIQTPELDVITGWGGGDCGYGFQVGKRYLVYAYRDAKDNRLSTSICTRTRLLADADDDLAFIRALPTSGMEGMVFGTVGRRNYEWKEGEQWFKPVADAEVTIEGKTTQYQAQSDARGNFRVEKILPGKYVVKLKLPPGLIRDALRKDEAATTVENELEVAAHGCAETDFYLESDTRLSGRVLDVEGNPVPNLPLNLRGALSDKRNVNTFLNATTDADGHFEFKIVPPGDYLLGFRLLNSSQADSTPYPRTFFPGVTSKALATIIKVKEGESLQRLDLQMPARLTQRTVEGIVVSSDGRPATGTSVYLNLIEEGEMTAFSSAQADENGRFTLKLYEGLQYKVSAYRQGAAGKGVQSEWIEIPMNSRDQPIRLVLPAQPRSPEHR
jgi:5-hydroxyisourate hydrolase-like protein (transthyretin family)